MCTSRTWTEQNLTTLFTLAKAYLKEPNFEKQYNGGVTFNDNVTDKEYLNFLNTVHTVLSSTTDKREPTTPGAINTVLTSTFTLDCNKWENVSDIAKKRAVAYKVGYITFAQFIFLNDEAFS